MLNYYIEKKGRDDISFIDVSYKNNFMKILHVTSSLDGGGIARLLFDYCSRMIPEFAFDFVLTSKEVGILEEPLNKLGCRIFHVCQFREHPFEHVRQLKRIMKDGKYDVVQDHSDYRGFFSLWVAKRCGIKDRIAHSHIAYVPEGTLTRFERKIFTPLVVLFASRLMACSKDAAIWVWGEKLYKKNKVYIMRNAINSGEFVYSEETRIKLRKELGLENCLVIGNVARFSYQKNHEKLIEIFCCLAERQENARLLLVGRGELLDEIKQMVKNKNIEERVLFLGVRNDVPELLNAMDVFVLPSRYEGLGIVYVEAQANGLICYATKDVVPEEVNICDNINYLPIDLPAEEWAEEILRNSFSRRTEVRKQIISKGYDIEEAVICLKEAYQEK